MTSYAKDSLGTRMKRFEDVSRIKLTPRSAVIVRVDGKAFHTWTKRIGCTKPYDVRMIEAMQDATRWTSDTMSGFKLGFTQSDEASFLLTDYDNLDTQGWFDYNLQKIVSVTASTFSVWFNHFMYAPDSLAVFDARAFVIPQDDIANYFLWRQKDWVRNSVQMLAQAHFTHKQLHGKKQADMHEMLHEKGINWADLDPVLKNGSYITGLSAPITDLTPSYPAIERLLDEILSP